MFLTNDQVTGHMIRMIKTDPRHLSGTDFTAKTKEPQDTVTDFGKLFSNALNNVNNSQIQSMELAQQMITDPESVNIHQVTTALAEANLSLSMTKAIFDGVLRAYREIINLR